MKFLIRVEVRSTTFPKNMQVQVVEWDEDPRDLDYETRFEIARLLTQCMLGMEPVKKTSPPK